MKIKKLFPFLEWLPKITKQSIIADIIAGITWAIIVLPQWIAFATIAGLPVEYGLYTAMVTPVIAALFGSSKHLISGPTTAISLVIFSTVSGFAQVWSPDFVSMAITLTLLAWIYQLAFWLARLWKIVDFVSHTVVIGFTAGAAILIVTSQIKSLLWIHIEAHEFYEVWKNIFSHLSEANIYAVWIGVITLILAIIVNKIHSKAPNLFIALIWGSLLAFILWADSQWVKFVPEIPSQLPPFALPDFSLKTLKALAPSAFAIAILWLIEAISISRSIASKSHQKINANQEFIGQGLSNMFWSFFSSYAWSGSFTRSGVNYSAWAQTPLSAIFAAIFLALIVLLIAPITKYLPIPAMAWVIMLVWYSLINFQTIKKIFSKSHSETAILLVTFFSTLFLELEFAIYLWILLSLIIFLNKTSQPKIVKLLSNYDSKKEKRTLVGTCKIKKEKHTELLCPQLEIIRIDMSIYFWSVNYIWEYISNILSKTWKKNVLILCSSINFIDMTWVEMLEEQHEILKEAWWWLYLVELKSRVYKQIEKYGLIESIWEDNFYLTKKWAIKDIYTKILDKDVCASCKNKVFYECWNTQHIDYTQPADIEDIFSLKDFSHKHITKIKSIFKKK